MGYNTRRVSLSLPSLGIALPGSNSSSRAHHKSSPSTGASSPSAGISKSSSDAPPNKRIKRSHTLTGLPGTAPRTSLPSRPRKSSSISIQSSQSPVKQSQQQQLRKERPQPQPQQQQPPQFQRPNLLGTPPPSPRSDDYPKLDTQGIGDDIVVAVLEQLQATGNRPHLIKELVAVLINHLSSVESSQNPVAIISSRLTNYLKRPWTALAPCPLTKEQVTVHPRRVYYYLTTMPRQELPEYADTPLVTRHIMSPSVSSGPDEEEEMEICTETRSASPEIEFLSAEYLNVPSDFADVSFSTDDYQDDTMEASQLLRNTRLGTPPLELDEREFTHAASVMQLRKQSDEVMQTQRQLKHEQMEQKAQEAADLRSGADGNLDHESFDALNETSNAQHGSLESNPLTNEDAALLWGQTHHMQQSIDVNSPIMRPQQSSQGTLSILASPSRKLSSMGDGNMFASAMHIDDNSVSDAFGAWGELKSPENVELAELDDIFSGF